jgi:hypothetical protein
MDPSDSVLTAWLRFDDDISYPAPFPGRRDDTVSPAVL